MSKPKIDLVVLLNRTLVANTNVPDPAAPRDTTAPAAHDAPRSRPVASHVARRAPPRRGAAPGMPRALRPRRRT